MVASPVKLFPSYKWQWATLTPTEGLIEPHVFIGVLRTLANYEGKKPNDSSFVRELKVIEKLSGTKVNLARTPERNIVRNSGQYWKALFLCKDTRGIIELTDFGRDVARGNITKSEFAARIIRTFELPNRNIEDNPSDWDNVGLKIKPFELISNILVSLRNVDQQQAYITSNELADIVIPLAGNNSDVSTHVESLIEFRKGALDISRWPNCIPEANDLRMVREYLLFLFHYGVCRCEKAIPRDRFKDKYYLDITNEEVASLLDVEFDPLSTTDILNNIRASQFPDQLEQKQRQKRSRDIYERPQQRVFRQDIINAYKGRCIFTGNNMLEALEAAHIMPVSDKGPDIISNGLCLRADIHNIYDSGHLRIAPDGVILLSEIAGTNYPKIPSKIKIPIFVAPRFVEWRWKCEY
jgi:hypothetical protein